MGGVEASAADAGDVLIVDDEADIREMVSVILEGEGYRVRTSANGREAIAAIERARPALVLLDLMMPGVTGWEVLDWLKHSGALSANQVVIMTAASDPCPSEFALLRKPFDVDELNEMIRRHTH
jgi:two-component system nitrogen regulation response regulator NtrX